MKITCISRSTRARTVTASIISAHTSTEWIRTSAAAFRTSSSICCPEAGPSVYRHLRQEDRTRPGRSRLLRRAHHLPVPSATFAGVRYATESATRDLYSTGNPYWNAVRKSWFLSRRRRGRALQPHRHRHGFRYLSLSRHFPARACLRRPRLPVGIINNCGADAACEDFECVHISRGRTPPTDILRRRPETFPRLVGGALTSPCARAFPR